MKKIIIPVMLITFIACNQPKEKQQMKFSYPLTLKDTTIDNYFGIKVADPYRWLENDTSKETAEWVKAQNELTFDYLSKIPYREKIKERLTQIWDYPKITAPFKRGGHVFFFKNDGLQNQNVLYIKENVDSKDEKVLLDPNKLSDDGTIALSSLGISKDGKYLAYGISRGGSDWNEIFVLDIKTGEKLSDHIEWVKFSGISWYKDGFYYSSYDKPVEGKELSNINEYHKIYYHKIGTGQTDDKLVYQNLDYPKRNYGVKVSEDEKVLIMTETESTHGNALYYKDLSKKENNFIKLAEGFEYEFGTIEHIDGELLVQTNFEAPKYKLISINLGNPSMESWKDIIPEKENVLESCQIIGGKIISRYMKDAYSLAEIYELNGEFVAKVQLPGIGTVSGFNGRKDENIAYYSFSSYTTPGIIYKFNVEKNTSEIYLEPGIDFDPTPYETKQVFYKSKDGTKIPMFVTHKKGLEMDGNNPTLLYGYGGFNISLTPGFSITKVIWMENGGVVAVANLRGGGEYGEEWHEAGTKLQKQNVFDDFIAAAEFLIENKYTSSKKLTIQGGSNGGLLVGACLNQRPDLFAVGLPAVGVMDMLRFHKFTIGWAWTGDYGSSDNEDEFHYLYKYSPLHNISKDVEYPATLVTSADHDDRVVPAHSFKYIAELQSKYQGENPVMIRIGVKAGHGGGKPTSKIIEEYADLWSFAFFNMGVTPKY
ncbi:MAG: S9 family peptidase [Bacteroidetes bacterium]|jgi:prolyl oligopeptidase|nr:S9 family peptidase [Bacteroidota bacterium]MBT6685880.1 S9 family peptidase [Bacteroidota bacterium]MBT7144056.1 S9 family peptidase [Bacteroidota bacterium]MBT7490978.1 S9 family peptidase [Bacteroidota bacterium]